jgi:hypothetical protein
VPPLEGAHTYPRSLPALDQAVREVIVLAADLPDEAMPELTLDYPFNAGDPELDTTALEVRRRLRRQADELAAAARDPRPVRPRRRFAAGHQPSARLTAHRQGQLILPLRKSHSHQFCGY